MNTATCTVCDRSVPVRSDGRLRAHLAAYGHRQACDGSGAFAAAGPLTEPPHPTRQVMSAAAAFNARAEWRKADVLYTEYLEMVEVGAADGDAIDEAYEACLRAVADARALDAMRLA
jgi:hypothetical protein